MSEEQEKELTDQNRLYGAIHKVRETGEPVDFLFQKTKLVIDEGLHVALSDPEQESPQSMEALNVASNAVNEFKKTALGRGEKSS